MRSGSPSATGVAAASVAGQSAMPAARFSAVRSGLGTAGCSSSAIAVGVVLPLLLWPVGLWIGLQQQPAEIASLWWFVGLRG